MSNLLGLNREATRVWRSSLFTVRLLALVMGSVAFAGVLFITEPPGPGLRAESGVFLAAAESLAAGQGYPASLHGTAGTISTSSAAAYPPGFAVAVAVPTYFGFPTDQAARLVEALAAFVAMAALLAVVGDAAGAGAALLFGIALLTTPLLVNLHLAVLSGPLFLAMLALTLALMVAAPDAAIMVGLCAALAFTVDYSGVGVVVAVAVWMLVRAGPIKVRVRRAVLALVPAIVLGVLWLLYLGAVHGSAVIAPAVPAGIAPVHTGEKLVRWLAPTGSTGVWSVALAVLVAALAISIVITGARRVYRLFMLLPRNAPLTSSTRVPQILAGRMLVCCVLLAAGYLGGLMVQRLVQGSLGFGSHALAPVVVLCSVVVAVAMGTWWRSAPRLGRAVALVAALVWMSASFMVSRARVHAALSGAGGLSATGRRPAVRWADLGARRNPQSDGRIQSGWSA